MDNITKLYEVILGYKCNMPDIDCNRNCDKCEDYLPNNFTAEKQLELIKFKCRFGGISIHDLSGHWKVGNIASGTFSQALAGLILQLWDELTDTQKEEIKEILE